MLPPVGDPLYDHATPLITCAVGTALPLAAKVKATADPLAPVTADVVDARMDGG
jgi:hypothetical protein